MNKLVLFVVVLLFAALEAKTPEFIELAKKLHEECNKKSPITPEVVAKVKKDAQMDENDDALKQHALCLAKTGKLVDENANIQNDLIRTYLTKMGLEKDVVEKAIEKCSKVEKGKDEALHVVRLHNCYYKSIPSEYIIF
ncbi:uncharacterized protein LOC123677755 [Harmonia axyridis]|uniref:Odorant binding protein 12 n=1 Tax=Harmonia axyridis TaxID=115357 RepID=A0A8J9RNL4_HARAX|nr:uncharacterized protein LOC123677755 [Harmonia axyridis]AVH84919.1 odorant binding protein 12 [Harmonia axyridis]QTE76115.1 odorant binding protein 7 [Harmonia axyridis]